MLFFRYTFPSMNRLNTRSFEHLGAPEDWDDNIICSLFALSISDTTDQAASTLAKLPNMTTGTRSVIYILQPKAYSNISS